MQLVAYGAQDIYLTGSPSITFWRIVYRRHTSFAQELISQVFNGTVGWGRRVSATVSRNGDLVYTGYLEIVLKRKVANDVDSSPYFPAEAAIESTELELGGQRIDLITSDFYRFYNELFRKDAEKDAYHRLTNFDDNTLDGVTKRFYLPLIFYWNRNPGLAIPLIALQYHELKLHIQFAQATTLARIGIDTSVDLQCELWLTYIYLDADERRRFAQSSHEYLISQVQTSTESVSPDASAKKTFNLRMNLNHPCKYVAWGAKGSFHGKFHTGTDLAATSDAYAPLYDAKITLNGQDRFQTKKGSWFNAVASYETAGSKPTAGLYIYPFALRSAEHQPSGTCNFSRIDNSTLILTFKAASAGTAVGNVTTEDVTLGSATELSNLIIWAENYNVLRIMSGMGGLAYSN